MFNLPLTQTQSNITSNLTISDIKDNTLINEFSVIDKVNKPDRFEIGNFSSQENIKETLVIIDGQFFRISKEQNNKGFSSNEGIFKTI